MRRGSNREDWTAAEVTRLRELAGTMRACDIADELGRTKKAVEHMAKRQGISLRLRFADLKWCSECATWRATVGKDGKCTVCKRRRMLEDGRARVRDAIHALPPNERLKFERGDRLRGSKYPPKPVKMASNPMSMRDRRRAETRYLRDIEMWEVRCLELQINSAKSRLKRIRRKTGTNPRKKSAV